MSLFDDASLVMIPSGYKEDTVYSVKPTDGSGDLTFTRASDGTRVNSDGLVERVPWNLLQQSNTFSNAVWNKSNTTVTSGQIGYDGLSNAWNLIPNTTNTSSHRMYIDYSSGGGVFTASIYVKANGYNFLALNNYSASVVFNISSGTIVSESGSPIESHIESVGNGWYKISVTKDSLSGNLRTQIFVQIDAANTSFSGDGTSGVLIQDAQLNEGTLKPYFPTTNRQDVPRLDYSNGCPCLLLEPQRTNLVTYSQDLSNPVYIKSESTVTLGQTSPDGQANAYRFTTTATTNPYIRTQPSATGTTYTQGVFAKYVNSQYIYFGGLGRNANENEGYVSFDIKNGTKGQVIGGSHNDFDIISIGNGWYYCWVSRTFSGSQLNVEVRVGVTDSVSSLVFSSGKSVDLYGFQLEAGSYPTSYIPTTSASVTRVADAASKTGISDLIGQSEGTLFLDFEIDDVLYPDNKAWVSIDDQSGAANNRIIFYMLSGASTARYQIKASGVTTSLVGSSISNQTQTKIAIAYKSGDIAVYKDGVLDASSTNSLTFNALMDRITFNYSNYPLVGKVNHAIIYKTRLTNDQLEYLTGNSYSTYATMASQLNYTIQ